MSSRSPCVKSSKKERVFTTQDLQASTLLLRATAKEILPTTIRGLLASSDALWLALLTVIGRAASNADLDLNLVWCA